MPSQYDELSIRRISVQCFAELQKYSTDYWCSVFERENYFASSFLPPKISSNEVFFATSARCWAQVRTLQKKVSNICNFWVAFSNFGSVTEYFEKVQYVCNFPTKRRGWVFKPYGIQTLCNKYKIQYHSQFQVKSSIQEAPL